MTPLLAILFALLAPQVSTPAATSNGNSQVVQPTQQPVPAALSPDAEHIYRVGGGVTPPKLIYKVDPVFTKEARKKKVSGVSTVRIIIDAHGNPQQVHIYKSIADTVDEQHRAAALTLDQVAVDVVKRYKFLPAMMDGNPVPVEMNIEIEFRIF